MPDPNLVDDLLDQLLSPKLGHACASWPRRLYERVERRAASSGCKPEELLSRLLRARDPEMDDLVDAATIGHTSFFRHPEQFVELRKVLRAWAEVGRVPVRIWCAGCSSGEEVYSIALTAQAEQVPVLILGTDVNPLAIQAARAGRYTATRTGRLPGNASEWVASPVLRCSIELRVSSLVGPEPALGKGPFDIIFCRNVLIYFDREDVPAILASIAEEVRPKGAIVVSPADAVLPLPLCLTRHARPGWLHLAGPHPASLRTIGAARAASVRPLSIRPRSKSPTMPPVESALDRAARLLGAGQGTQAETVLGAWLDREPDHIGGWFMLGEALLQRGEKAQARAAFVRASQCSPRDTDQIDGEAMRWAAIRRAEELLT